MYEILLQLVEKGGPIGVCLSLAFLYIRQLNSEIRAVEDRRVSDAKAMIDKLLVLNDKWNEAINTSLVTADGQKDATEDLKKVMDEIMDTVTWLKTNAESKQLRR